MSRQVMSPRTASRASGGPRASRAGRLIRLAPATALLALPVVLAGPASAHVTITPSTTEAGANAVLTVSIGHGCAGSPTTAVQIRIPAGVYSVTPTRNPLWDLEVTKEPVVPPATDEHGARITDRVSSVTYRTDTPLPDDQRDTFDLSLRLPAQVGSTLVFPIVQTCEKGESAWIEVPAAGQDGDDLELPAPAFVVTGTGTATTAVSTGATSEDGAPAVRLVAGDRSSGSSLLSLGALGVGVVGVLLGLAALTRLRHQS